MPPAPTAAPAEHQVAEHQVAEHQVAEHQVAEHQVAGASSAALAELGDLVQVSPPAELVPPAPPAELAAIYEPARRGIMVTAPIAGKYMLIEHTPDYALVRDPVVILTPGAHYTFKLHSNNPHHIQVWSETAAQPMLLYTSAMFTRRPYHYFYAMIGK